MAKASKAQRQARALCVELARVTGGRPVQWRMLHEIEERLGFEEARSDQAPTSSDTERAMLERAGEQLQAVCR